MNALCSHCEMPLSRAPIEARQADDRLRCPSCDKELVITLEPCPLCGVTFRSVDPQEFTACRCCGVTICGFCAVRKDARVVPDLSG